MNCAAVGRRADRRAGSLRIAFFGLPLAAVLLRRDGHDVTLACLGRARAPGARRLRAMIGADRVLVRPRLDEALQARVAAGAPDLLVSWFWTTKLPMSLVEVCPMGGFGVHPSLLPRHRGPDPTSWAILQGDAVTGVTAHRIAAAYDTGALLARRELAIDPDWNAWQLARALDRPSLALLREVCASFARGAPPPDVAQDESQATEAPLLDDDARILRWAQSTDALLRSIRSLAPSPGAETEIADAPALVLRARACPVPAVLEEPGEAAAIGERAIVRTGDGAIELVEIEREGVTLRGPEIAGLLATQA